MLRSRLIARTAAALVAAALLACFPAAAKSRYRVSDAPDPQWREGPVRYIITKSEDKAFQELETEAERVRFIEEFWLRRDPDPSTPGNEYRADFWRRVRRATSLYGKSTPKPGWLTDMGKIYILFGPPDEISRDEMNLERRDITVWIYRNTPGVGPSRLLAGANQVIAFARDSSGEYRLTTEPSKTADVWEGLPDPQPPMGQMAGFRARQQAFEQAMADYIGLTDPIIRAHGGPPTGGSLGLRMTLARLQQPPREWELNSEIRTREFFGSLPFRARADFFGMDDGRCSVLLTVAVKSMVVTYRGTPRGDEPAVEAVGTLFDSTGTVEIGSLDGTAGFRPAPENDRARLDDDLIYQARVVLPPGSYRARLTLLDEVSGKSSTSETPFTVPDFSAMPLAMSSVSLARSISSAEEGDRGYLIGSLRVLPRLGNVYQAGEELSFYYQIYGAARSEETGKPMLDVTYTFLAAQGEDVMEIGRVAFEDQNADAHGYALPLEGWPAGSYVVRIEITDSVAGTSVARDLAFRIDEPASGS